MKGNKAKEFEPKGRVYTVGDSCRVDSPRRSIVKRHLKDHGAESPLTSERLGEFAACVMEELLESGARVLEPGEPAVPLDSPAEPLSPQGNSGKHEPGGKGEEPGSCGP